MTKRYKMGLLTLWGAIYVPFTMLLGLDIIKVPFENVIILLHIITMGISFYLIYAYSKNAIENTQISSNKKLAWIITFFVFSPISMLIYFYKYGEGFNTVK